MNCPIFVKIIEQMLSSDNSEEFYSRFHEQLLTSQVWPGKYMFKFIVRAGGISPEELKHLFIKTDAQFSEKQSNAYGTLPMTFCNS